MTSAMGNILWFLGGGFVGSVIGLFVGHWLTASLNDEICRDCKRLKEAKDKNKSDSLPPPTFIFETTTSTPTTKPGKSPKGNPRHRKPRSAKSTRSQKHTPKNKETQQ